MRHGARIAIAVMFVWVLASCQSRRMFVGPVAAVLEAGEPAYENETDLDLLALAFPSHIKLLEAMLTSNPENARLQVLLSKLYGGYALSEMETKLEASKFSGPETPENRLKTQRLESRAGEYYRRGADYALRALGNRYPGAGDQLRKIAEVPAFLDRLDAEDVPALFWYGFNLASWINLSRNDVSAVAQLHLVEKVMKRVIELDETYYHGGAHMALLVYYGSRTPMMGGSLKNTRNHYEALRRLTGNDLRLADVFLARYLMVAEQDRLSFERLLSDVVASSPEKTACPMLNQVAVARARIYLDAASRFFE